MAEKGIVVDDAATGESVACRDAMQQDDESNNRIIQLTDRASRPVIYQRTTYLREEVDTSDSFDIDPLPTAIANSLITVSDAEVCIVWGVFGVGSTSPSDGIFIITPIIVSDDSTPEAVTLLPPFQIRPIYPKKMSNSTIGGDALNFGFFNYPTLAHAFPTLGANRIGLHVTKLAGDSNVTLDLFAAPGSSSGRNSAIDIDVMNDTWGTAFGYGG